MLNDKIFDSNTKNSQYSKDSNVDPKALCVPAKVLSEVKIHCRTFPSDEEYLDEKNDTYRKVNNNIFYLLFLEPTNDYYIGPEIVFSLLESRFKS